MTSSGTRTEAPSRPSRRHHALDWNLFATAVHESVHKCPLVFARSELPSSDFPSLASQLQAVTAASRLSIRRVYITDQLLVNVLKTLVFLHSAVREICPCKRWTCPVVRQCSWQFLVCRTFKARVHSSRTSERRLYSMHQAITAVFRDFQDRKAEGHPDLRSPRARTLTLN